MQPEPNASRPWRRVARNGCLAVIAIPVVLTIVAAVFNSFGCREGPGNSVLSFDAKLQASEYYRSCRGETQTMELLINSIDSIPHGPGNVFSVALVGATDKTWPMMALWSDSGLDVTYDSRVQIRMQRHEFQGIRIFYIPDTANAPRR